MSAYGGELFPNYSEVAARREWEIGLIQEKLERNEAVDLPLCRIERVGAGESTVRFGLKRGKLLYVFKYHTHDVERDKHRNVITRARFIKAQLESVGYRLIPWDFKKGSPPKFWEEGIMDEEDDDLYGPAETAAPAQPTTEVKSEDSEEGGDEPMDEGLESGEDDDEDDSDDSDIDIIIDRPVDSAPKPMQQQQPQESRAIKIEAPSQPSTTPSQGPKTTVPQLPAGQPGTSYPAVRTSSIDVAGDPVYTPLDKPITQVDIDSDLAEATKPWRLPGSDQSDYFNYGFDEFTWEMYRQRQQTMSDGISQQTAEMAQMQQMLSMGGGGGPGPGPGAANPPVGPSGGGGGGPPAGMPGMPGEDQMMQMMQQMMAQGIDPNGVDFNQFMALSGFANPGEQQAGGYGGGGGGQQPNQGRGGGRGRGGRGRGW